MTHVQLLVDDDAERHAVGRLLAQGDYSYTTGETPGDANLFVVDDYTLPDVRDALRATKRARHPEFCPVVLIRREGTRIDLERPAQQSSDRVLAVDETIEAPVEKEVFYRRLSNLLVRQQQTEELAEQNERLDAFAKKVSHELRNPLNVLQGRLDLARETGDPDHLDAMEQSVERIQRLVKDVLSLARTGEIEVEPSPVRTATLVESCWASVETSMATLDVEDAPDVLADEDRLHQVFANLFRNAVEHGGTEVSVTVGALADGFYVADDGPGIPPGERDSVLERGYSGDGHGTGLGLAVVVEVASAHGWHLEVTESASGGARFEFRDVTFATPTEQ